MKIFNRIILVVSTFIYIIVGFFCLSVSFSQKANQWLKPIRQTMNELPVLASLATIGVVLVYLQAPAYLSIPYLAVTGLA